jgi:hypothetical protein
METVFAQIEYVIGPFQLVSGGADGPDSEAEYFIQSHWDLNWPEPIIHKPQWYVYRVYQPGAALKRNTYIIEDADWVLAFYNGTSRGTWDSITKARKMGKPLMIVYEDGRVEWE